VKNFDHGVEEFLICNGCTHADVDEIKNRHVLIIFDGYDEIEQAINIYDRNKLHDWKNAKVIFTSRKEYVLMHKDSPLANFAPDGRLEAVMAVDILPINEIQLKEYLKESADENARLVAKLDSQIQRFRKRADHSTSEQALRVERDKAAMFQDPLSYLKWIDEVEDVLTSPLMMRIFIETLPSLEGDTLNKGLMFEQFAKIHFEA
jgi:hypothetical protein